MVWGPFGIINRNRFPDNFGDVSEIAGNGLPDEMVRCDLTSIPIKVIRLSVCWVIRYCEFATADLGSDEGTPVSDSTLWFSGGQWEAMPMTASQSANNAGLTQFIASGVVCIHIGIALVSSTSSCSASRALPPYQVLICMVSRTGASEFNKHEWRVCHQSPWRLCQCVFTVCGGRSERTHAFIMCSCTDA